MPTSESSSDPVDVLVVGLGGVGSAACYALAKQGYRVVGIDQFSPPHCFGSSHGDTRIIRKSYFEHPSYVPLLQGAYQHWQELEIAFGKQLYFPTGLLEIGPADGLVIQGVLQSAKDHSLPIETFSMPTARNRYPGIDGEEHWQVILEEDAGYLLVEECISAHLQLASSLGAEIRINEKMLQWHEDNRGIIVDTDQATLRAKKLILCAGPWATQAIGEIGVPLQVLHKHLYWYSCKSPRYSQDQGFPCFFFDTPTGYYYGFPDHSGNGLKVARHSGGESVIGPVDGKHPYNSEDQHLVELFLRNHLPDAKLELIRTSGCYYTMTPDEHFIVDRLPSHPNAIVIAGLSGHGFKFTSVLGQIACEMATQGGSSYDLDFLSLKRFNNI